MKLLVVFDELNSDGLTRINGYNATEAEVVNLSNFSNDQISKRLTFINQRPLVEKHQAASIKLMTDWVGQIGAKKIYNSKNIKELLVGRNGISLWWFNAFQYKFFNEYQLFNWLVFSRVIAELISVGKYEECVIFGGQKKILQQLQFQFPGKKLNFQTNVAASGTSETAILIRGILSAVLYAVYSTWQILAIALFYRPKQKLDFCPDVTLLSIYPGSLNNVNGEVKERYYGPLPEKLIKKGLAINYLAHLHVRNELRGLFDLQNFKAAADNKINITFIESMLSFGDILVQFLNYLKLAWRIKLLPRKVKMSLFILGQDDFSPLFYEYFLTSIYDYSNFRMLLLIQAAYKYAQKVNPKMLFTCYVINHVGRAINVGFRLADNNIPIIGVQHASFPSSKLETRYARGEIDPVPGGYDLVSYAPYADLEIFQSAQTRDNFIMAGLPETRALLFGTPRSDLITYQGRAPSFLTNKKKLLIGTGLFDYDIKQLLDIIFDVVDESHFLIFKPHPNRDIRPFLSEYLKDKPRLEYIVSNDNIYSLISEADILITGHSTVAEEAIALGKPAISVHAGPNLDISALSNLAVRDKLCAGNAQELREKITQLLAMDKTTFTELQAYVIKQCFGILDGKATERTADFIQNKLESINSMGRVS